jgi:energy-converting hydrogenase Eha subunit F
MEEYRSYIRHKSLENIMSTVLIVFVILGVFVVGKTLNPEQKYASAYSYSVEGN